MKFGARFCVEWMPWPQSHMPQGETWVASIGQHYQDARGRGHDRRIITLIQLISLCLHLRLVPARAQCPLLLFALSEWSTIIPAWSRHPLPTIGRSWIFQTVTAS